jgi:hypothetical protein
LEFKEKNPSGSEFLIYVLLMYNSPPPDPWKPQKKYARGNKVMVMNFKQEYVPSKIRKVDSTLLCFQTVN